MTDAQVEQTEQTEQAANAAEPQQADKPVKTVKEPHACLCQSFEIGKFETEGTSNEQIFSTGCELTTKSTFGQGHDARLVSFLVDGHADGYEIRQVVEGKPIPYATPADAVAGISEALHRKATIATENKVARRDAAQKRKDDREAARVQREADKAAKKAQREAEKAAKAAEPQSTGAEVVAGSTEGEPVAGADGTVKIKVGRWEYDAIVDPETGEAFYTDGSGKEMSVGRDGYRVLTPEQVA